MQRTDPQYKLRIPESLKSALEDCAKEAKRSLNAEIIARLEASTLLDPTDLELMPAARAKEMSAIARQSIPGIVKKRVLEGINQSVAMGHATASIDLRDLELDALPGADVDDLMDRFSGWLRDAGYEIEWDGPENLWIRFGDL